MCIVALPPALTSANAVFFGRYGDVSRLAQRRQVSRQALYREAHAARVAVEGTRARAAREALTRQVHQLQARVAALERQLAQAVVIGADKQAEYASTAQARGISLADARALLHVLLGPQTPSRAALGRQAQEAARRAAALLPILDALSRPRARQAVADEIFAGRRPVLMLVEPDSLCWLSGRLAESRDGAQWVEEFRALPALEQLTRDAGGGLTKGVALLNDERQAQGLPAVADQLDHFHSLRGGGGWLARLEGQARVALEQAEAASAARARAAWRGEKQTGASNRLRAAWAKAERALDAWREGERRWQAVKEAVQLFTPEGEVNTRARAEALLAEALPHLPDPVFAKAKRLLGQREAFTYLDEVQRRLAALPVPEAVRQAAVQQEGLRRRPGALAAPGPRAAALRGALLACAVVLAKAGPVGEQAVAGVRLIFRHTWRASSLVECINSVLRMQQARHRRLSQSLLDLKRLYWNVQVFRAGRRRGESPYGRLGLVLPEGGWWQLLKMTPEQLRLQLSELNPAA